MDRIHLAQVKHKWRGILNIVMIRKALSNAGNFLPGSRTSSVSRRTCLVHGDRPQSKAQSVKGSDGIATSNFLMLCVCMCEGGWVKLLDQ
jgi:hypothetical protein